MSNTDKRTPHTDALDSLGMILNGSEHRDAIHLGVEPVIAGMHLVPGDRIGLKDGLAYRLLSRHDRGSLKYMGIVDPFLPHPIESGDRFWLVVPPRTITSLRHVWEHPDFPKSQDIPETVEEEPIDPEEHHKVLLMVGDPVAIARERIREIADNLDVTEEWLMSNADDVQDGSDEWVCHPVDSGAFESVSLPSDFWDNYAKVKEVDRSSVNEGLHFTCSC